MTKNRLEAFSDGVFAIVITLLVLDVQLPDVNVQSSQDLLQLIQQVLPNILTFVFSFLVVGVFWVAHHRIFDLIRYVNHYLLWSNIFYLLTIAIIPFPAAVLARHPLYTVSVIFYSAVLALVGLQHFLFLLYLRRHVPIQATGFTQTVYNRAMKTAAVGPAFYMLAIVASLIHTVVSFCLILAALVFYIFLAPLLLKSGTAITPDDMERHVTPTFSKPHV